MTVTIDTEGPTVNTEAALSFDEAGDYVATPNLRSQFSSDTVTVEMWFSASGPGVLVAEAGSASPNSAAWHNSQLEVLSTGEVTARVWNLTPVSVGTVGFGGWHHVALRYDQATGVLDGVLDGVQSGASTSGNRTAPWDLGNGLHYLLGAADSTHMGSGASFAGRKSSGMGGQGTCAVWEGIILRMPMIGRLEIPLP